MAEYISREAALESVREKLMICDLLPDTIAKDASLFTLASMQDSLKSIPAADVREVVMCKNCRHRDPEDHKCDCGQLERAGCIFPVADDYFCAYGERNNCGADMRETT